MSEILRQSAFFGAALTIIAFEAANIIGRKLKNPIFNPFLIATLIIIAVLTALNISYDEYNTSAQHLFYFATPSTVCLAVPLYRKLTELKKNLPAIIISIVCGILANMVIVLLLCKIFALSHNSYASLLPKSVTTPIALALCGEYGGIQSITVLAVLFTGILGNVLGESVLKILRIRHSVSKGLAMGASSHAIGTAKAMEFGTTEGAMSGLAIAVTGVLTVVIAPFFTSFI